MTWLLSSARLAGRVDFAGRRSDGWMSESRPFGREQDGNICLENLFVLMKAAAVFLKVEDYRTGKPVPRAEDICSALSTGLEAPGFGCRLPSGTGALRTEVGVGHSSASDRQRGLLGAPPLFRNSFTLATLQSNS